jgi:acetate kinase
MTAEDVLVVDAGSHSLRLVVVTPGGQRRRQRVVDAPPDSRPAREALSAFVDQAGEIAAVGHRVVHGGEQITGATIVDDEVLTALRQAAALAPLHVPVALAAIESTMARLPAVPHVVAVDTAFHASMPEVARTYALPTQ